MQKKLLSVSPKLSASQFRGGSGAGGRGLWEQVKTVAKESQLPVLGTAGVESVQPRALGQSLAFTSLNMFLTKSFVRY